MKRFVPIALSAFFLFSCGNQSASSFSSESHRFSYSESSYSEETPEYVVIDNEEANDILLDIYNYYDGEVYCSAKKATIENKTKIDDPNYGKVDMEYLHDFDDEMKYYRVYTKLHSSKENVELTQFKFMDEQGLLTVNRYEDGSENTYKIESIEKENFMVNCNPYASLMSEYATVFSYMAQAVKYTGTSTKSTFRTVDDEEGTLQLEFSFTSKDNVLCYSKFTIREYMLTETINTQTSEDGDVYVSSHFKVTYGHLLHFEDVPDFSSYRLDQECHNTGNL